MVGGGCELLLERVKRAARRRLRWLIADFRYGVRAGFRPHCFARRRGQAGRPSRQSSMASSTVALYIPNASMRIASANGATCTPRSGRYYSPTRCRSCIICRLTGGRSRGARPRIPSGHPSDCGTAPYRARFSGRSAPRRGSAHRPCRKSLWWPARMSH